MPGLMALRKEYGEQQILKGDVLNYYTYLPALLIDGDASFTFRKERLVQESNDQILGTPMPNGKFIPKMSMGMALLYSPFFLIGHAVASISDYPNNGFSLPYIVLMMIGHFFYFFMGLYYLRKVLLENSTFLIAWKVNFHQEITIHLQKKIPAQT